MKYLVLKGTAHERGLIHGKAWPKEIHEFAAIRKFLLKDSLNLWSEPKLNKLLDAHIEVLKKDKDLWSEFCGIAEGAEISHRDLMILNNHTDLRDFGDGDFDERLLECSCFAFKQNEKIVAGQTWDMHGSAKPYVAHLRIEKEHQTQEVFTLTGCLGLTGVSSNGFAVFINNLRSREVSIGYAWPAVVRKLLNCSSIEEAKSVITSYMPSGGRNFLLVDKNGATNLEVTAKRTESTGDLSSGYLFHTNHYVSSLKSTEESSSRSKTTLKRYECLAKVAPKVAHDKELSIQSVAKNILGQSTPELSIPLNVMDPHASATCGGLVYDFEEKKGVSFEGLFRENNQVEF